LCGDSAGGNIVHHVAVRAAEKDLGPDVRLAGLVMIQPFFGGEERTRAEIRLKSPAILTVDRADWYWKAYLPRDADRDHPASRVFGPRAKDLRSVAMPPALVIIGGLDMMQDWDVSLRISRLVCTWIDLHIADSRSWHGCNGELSGL
jgi:gibberellin receptor GID1